MPLIDYTKLPKQKIWEGITGAIYHSNVSTMAHIEIEEGIVLPTHQHIHEQWSHVVEGIFEFELQGVKHLLTSGMTLHIPSNVPHSGKCISKCKIIDCFIPVREDWKSLPYA